MERVGRRCWREVGSAQLAPKGGMIACTVRIDRYRMGNGDASVLLAPMFEEASRPFRPATGNNPVTGNPAPVGNIRRQI